MADVFSKEKRSEVMSRIRSRGNRNTEVSLALLLRAHHVVGWRRHGAMIGRPDFVFRKERVAVFVDGCFWHRCPLCAQTPATNRDYWDSKLIANHKRDRKVNRALRKAGWTVVRVWEHSLNRPSAVMNRLRRALNVRSQKGG